MITPLKAYRALIKIEVDLKVVLSKIIAKLSKYYLCAIKITFSTIEHQSIHQQELGTKDFPKVNILKRISP